MNDHKQRDEALNLSDSFIVQAPAGSGKTELITQRYLKLLGSAEVPENILVMTFTNRAVDELKHRIIGSLNRATKKLPDEEYKRTTHYLANEVLKQSQKKGWDLINHSSRLKIITIDSLSNLIVSRFPSVDQLIPPRTIIDSFEYENIYRQAAKETLLLIEDDEYQEIISSVLLYLDNDVDRFYRLIEQMLGKREQWLPKIYAKGVIDISYLEDFARVLIEDHLELLRDQAKKILSTSFFNLLKNNKREDISKITKLPGIKISDLKEWKIISELLVTKNNGNWRKRVDVKIGFSTELNEEKVKFKEFLEGLDSQIKFKDLLVHLDYLPSANLNEVIKKSISDIVQVLKLSVAKLKIIFDEQSLQDFSEVNIKAINALDSRQEVSDIALLMDYQIQHILIDEFQDTSYSQLNLIEGLIEGWQQNEERTMFIVGDPMQSIYKFRESQVGIFISVARNGIGRLNIKSLTLSSNFRSNKNIVESNNEIFSKIFPQNDDLLKGAIQYASSVSFSDVEETDAISFYAFGPNNDLEEAEKVYKIINESLLEDSEGEIAVLVRSRSHLKEISLVLRKNKINFESLKTESLRSNPFTRDLLSLVRALLSLSDKLAWLAILRSPWCGIRLNDLLILSQSNDQTIYSQLMDLDSIKGISSDCIKRSQHIYFATRDAISAEGKFSFVERFSFTMNQLFNENELTRIEKSIKTQFLELLNHCELNQTLNAKTIESMLQDLYAPSYSSNVKLMTVHQSKGLEFDTVIIPGLGKRGRSDNLPLIQIQEFPGNKVLLSPIKPSYEGKENKTYLYLQYLKKQQSHFELMRLLYVAMSRAKNKIHLLGSVSKNGKVANGSFLSLLSSHYEENLDFDIAQGHTVSKELSAPKLLRVKKIIPFKNHSIHNSDEQKNNPKTLDLIYQGALGTIVHHYLELEKFDPPLSSIETRLREMGLPSKLLKTFRTSISEILSKTKHDDNFEWIFKYRESTQVEAEFRSAQQTVIVDRLFIDDGILWIIDFKTSSVNEGETLDKFIERQKISHQSQIEKYKEVLDDFFDFPIKAAIYCPAVSQLIFS
ncbi:UvrD-helicase domain-containing protein [Candidatus Thioglobus sp.]|nr:UvrD-helicase domain-containing protein [Candidatus Thioglobus sp.]